MRGKANPLKKANAIPCNKLFAGTVRRLKQRKSTFGEQAFAFRFARGPELADADVAAAVDLIEAGLKHHAEHSSMGWSRDEKVHQLADPASRLVLVRAVSEPVSTTPVDADADAGAPADSDAETAPPFAALLCLRFEPEEDADPASAPVVYCYELHVAAPYRRTGLGRFLARELAHLARTAKMDRVLLTVLLENKGALAFYDALGFYTDEGSPDDTDYRILALDPA